MPRVPLRKLSTTSRRLFERHSVGTFDGRARGSFGPATARLRFSRGCE